MTEYTDSFFERLVDLITEIVTGIQDHEIIYIRKDEVVASGYSDRESFEMEYLPRVFKEASSQTNVGIELIKNLIMHRINYSPPKSDPTRNNQRGNNI